MKNGMRASCQFSIVLVLLVTTASSPNVFAANIAHNYQDLPESAFPALYYWSNNAWTGFGPNSTTYRYGSHPGYERRVSYYKDLDNGHGYLVEHPAALVTIFAESEAAAEASEGYWQDIVALYWVGTFNIGVSGTFGPSTASWNADVWFRTSNSVHFVEGYS